MRRTTELLVSEITVMGAGFCVIGLERLPAGFRSLRPIPRNSYSWTKFSHQRGDRVAFELSFMSALPPHGEDRRAGNFQLLGSVSEAQLLECLKRAELAGSVKDLFGCAVHPSPRGGEAVYADCKEAQRSICGCEIAAVSFSFRFYPPKIRAAVALKSGETLESLPVVDAGWIGVANDLTSHIQDDRKRRLEAQHFFDSVIQKRIISSNHRFARIGLARPKNDEGFCWLMLDTLFPLPNPAWLNEAK
jgi:hypothetical protein